jgi:hypothetical protein
MNPPGSFAVALSAAATRLPFVRPRLRAAFLLALIAYLAPNAWAQNASFLPSLQTNIWAVAQTNPNARKTYFVPTTNADRLTVLSSAATTNLNLTVGNPTFDQFGPVNYVATSNASTNTFTLIASNSSNNSFATTNITITVQPLPPLEVRFFDMRADKTVPVQVLPVGTGANDLAGDCSFFYVASGTTNTVANGYSVGASNLPTVITNNNITGQPLAYQTLYVSNVQSGTIWIGLTEQAYTNALDTRVGNPAAAAAPGLQWSQAPFGEIEYSYTGGGYDTADVTMINSIAVPALLRLANSSGLYPGSAPVGVTNSNNLAAALPGIRLQPGASWFGPAPNPNLIRLIGPSSALNGAIQIANGDATNTNSGPLDAGNYYTGWPGFNATPVSPYVSKVALATTNPTPGNSNSTRIEKLIGDPDAESWCAQSLWYFAADLTFTPNTNQLAQWGPLSSNYVTPVPVLTNVTITNIVTFTNGTKVTNSWTTGNLAAAYTPDSGSPTNSVFSFYVYAAPASFNGPANQGYVTFYAGGVTNQFAWTNLANYTNSNYGAGQNKNSPNWNPYVLDAFLNEIAFGFAGGFVHSPVMGYTNGWQYNAQGRITNNTNTTPPNVPIGSMTSPQWWQQTNLYAQLQPASPTDYTWYSKWGNSVFTINPSIYSHPISDRMEYEGFTPGLPLGAANTNTNVWLEIYFYDVPAPAPSANRPAISLITTNGVAIPSTNFPYVTTANLGALAPTNTNLLVVRMTNADPGGWQPQFAFPSLQIAATNTNGGGLRIGSLPNGLSYDPATRTITGTLGSSLAAGGYASIGLMPYSSNDLTVATIPIYVAPVDTDPTVTNVLVTNNYPTNVDVSAVAMPGETITIKGYNFTNYPGIPPLNQIQFVNGPLLTNGFTVVDGTTITATLPATNWTGVYRGPVIVQRVFTNGNGQLATNGVGWTNDFGIPMPQISGFEPTSTQSGSNITLRGFFYGVTNVVFFKHLAQQTSTTSFVAPSYPYTNLVVTVPSGTPGTTGLLEVKSLYANLTPNLSTNAVSTANFTLAAPAVAPVGPLIPTTLGVLNRYAPRITNVSNLFQFPPWSEVPSAGPQVTVSNNADSMTVASGASWSATGLPRGFYLVNHVQGGQVFGQIIGAAIDHGSNNVAITASNSAGVTNFTLPLVINTTLTSLGAASNAPVLYGPNSFSVSTNAYTNLVVTYSNGPTYFALTGLPPGMTNTLTVSTRPDAFGHGMLDGEFALSVYGTPTTPGTYTVTSTAVNIVTNGAGVPSAMTNIATFTINVAGSPPPYLTYNSWAGAWALSGSNTNTTADPDNDGFDNNDEYAFGGNPTNPTPYLLNISGSNISYIGLTNANTNYTVQNTTNLSTGPWTNYATTVTTATNQLNIPLPAYYQRKEFTVPINAGTNNFYRVIFSNQ